MSDIRIDFFFNLIQKNKCKKYKIFDFCFIQMDMELGQQKYVEMSPENEKWNFIVAFRNW